MTLVGLALAGCDLLGGITQSNAQPSGPVDAGATAQPSASMRAIEASGSPQDAAGSGTPSAATSEPVPIPDLPGSDVHRPGETFAVPGAIMLYQGVFRSGSQFVVRFDVVSGTLAGDVRILMADGGVRSVGTGTGAVESAPFGDGAHPLARDELLTLTVADHLYGLEVGEIR